MFIPAVVCHPSATIIPVFVAGKKRCEIQRFAHFMPAKEIRPKLTNAINSAAQRPA